MTMRFAAIVLCAMTANVGASGGDARFGVQAPQQAAGPRQTEEDDYTRYELLAPETQQFAIVYDVTATTAGARFYFNPIRKGSEATDERVIDLMSGQSLTFDVVSGAEAKRGGHPTADVDTNYIRIRLPRPVPVDGEVRLRIWKTYKDPKTYYREGDTIVFDRSLGIKRNAVVLPTGYELVACNMPSQVLTEADGRTKISFMNASAAAAPLVVKARPVARTGSPATGGAATLVAATGATNAALPPRASDPRLTERAFQDREIVYFLQQPDTHAFSLYHDYTESREGVDKYLNVVRAGSTVANPSARILDTGEPLRVETLKGAAITAAKIDIGEEVTPSSEVVVIHFPAVKKGTSVRLRISETYTDAARYKMDGDLLVWDRAFGRPRNTVILPEGWSLVDSSIPAVVSLTEDGRTRLYFENNRPDEIATLIRARRRASQ
jgi:hypothetical protein